MQHTVRFKLNPDQQQSAALIDTLNQYAACFDRVASVGYETHTTNGVTLHHATYYPLREQYPDLPAQLVCSSRVRATEALKAVRTNQRKHRNTSCPTMKQLSMRLDDKTYRLLDSEISVSSVAKRLIIPFSGNPHAEKWLAVATGTASADLVFRNGKFTLHVVVNVPDKPFVPNGQVVGVDLGINRPAVASNRLFHGERRWKNIDRRYFRLKRKLQAKGTKSAKRHLRKLSGTVTRFRRDCDHVISRRIIDSVEPGTVIAVEKLTNIRSGVKQRGTANRRRLHSWSFAQLQSFLTYKAEDAGCLVASVDPRHTSQTCSKCGHVSKSNRKSQSVFKCRKCGCELNADLNAAINIAAKYRVGDGKSVSGGPLSTGLSSRLLLGQGQAPAFMRG